MSLSSKANGAFKRLSTGPLYSQKELAKAETFLAAEGFTPVQDNAVLGMRIYNKGRAENGTAVIYLDELNCRPENSGIMIVTKPGQPTFTGGVWDYVRQKDIEATKNPVLKFLKKANPFS